MSQVNLPPADTKVSTGTTPPPVQGGTTTSMPLNSNLYWVLMDVFADQQVTQQKLQECSLSSANSLNEQMKAKNQEAKDLTSKLTDKKTKKIMGPVQFLVKLPTLPVTMAVDYVKTGSIDSERNTVKNMFTQPEDFVNGNAWDSTMKVDKTPDQIAKDSNEISNVNTDIQLLQTDYNKEFNVYFQNQSNNEQAAAKLFNSILDGFASVGKTS